LIVIAITIFVLKVINSILLRDAMLAESSDKTSYVMLWHGECSEGITG